MTTSTAIMYNDMNDQKSNDARASLDRAKKMLYSGQTTNNDVQIFDQKNSTIKSALKLKR